jgi:hypothetical protein
MAVAQRLGNPVLAESARTAYVHGMSVVLLVCAAIAVVGALLVIAFMPSRPVAEPMPTGEESAHEFAGIA